MANQERVKLWNVRTTKMTDEMYNFVLDRISKTSEGTFRVCLSAYRKGHATTEKRTEK